LLQNPRSPTQENVASLIKYIEGRKKIFEDGGWNISCPRGKGKKPMVINVRQVVCKIMEAALEFKDIFDAVLEFDATGDGILSSHVFCQQRRPLTGSGALAWIRFYRVSCGTFQMDMLSDMSRASYKDEVLDWVSKLRDSAHTNIRNKLQDNIKDGARKWLLKRQKFKEWEDASGAAGLWLRGKGTQPRSKSTMLG
jgi:hypothetical protein